MTALLPFLFFCKLSFLGTASPTSYSPLFSPFSRKRVWSFCESVAVFVALRDGVTIPCVRKRRGMGSKSLPFRPITLFDFFSAEDLLLIPPLTQNAPILSPQFQRRVPSDLDLCEPSFPHVQIPTFLPLARHLMLQHVWFDQRLPAEVMSPSLPVDLFLFFPFSTPQRMSDTKRTSLVDKMERSTVLHPDLRTKSAQQSYAQYPALISDLLYFF